MEFLRMMARRMTMTVIFCLALLTTFESISGVTAKEISHWWIADNQEVFERNNREKLSLDVALKNFSLKLRSLPFFKKQETMMSSQDIVEAEVLTLEDAIDWSNYPSRQVVATGYTAGFESTGKRPGHPQYGITYSGVKVTRDLYSTIAADLGVFPIGSILFIPGYGYGVVADTGSAIKGNKIDLYYETVQDVFQYWGKKEVEVYLVEEGSGRLTEDELQGLNEAESVQVFRRQLSFAK